LLFNINNLWHTADNWSLGIVPQKDHLVQINDGCVVVNKEAACGQLTISEKSSLIILDVAFGIAYNGPSGEIAVTNNGVLNVMGSFFIDRSGNQAEVGLQNNGKLINHDLMVIRNGIADDGIRIINGQFVNYGELRIENENASGIYLDGGYFINEGVVKNSGFSGDDFITGGRGIFINELCAKVYNGDAPIVTDRFKNEGMIIDEGTSPSLIDSHTGIIWNLAGGDFMIRSGNGLITTDEK